MCRKKEGGHRAYDRENGGVIHLLQQKLYPPTTYTEFIQWNTADSPDLSSQVINPHTPGM